MFKFVFSGKQTSVDYQSLYTTNVTYSICNKERILATELTLLNAYAEKNKNFMKDRCKVNRLVNSYWVLLKHTESDTIKDV